MPSIHRPNAPQRLPSGAIERSVFRHKKDRSSREADASSTPLPISPLPSSIPCSPTTIPSPKPLRPPRNRFQSADSVRSSPASEGFKAAFALGLPAPYIFDPESSSKKPSLSESIKSEPEPSSKRSSISTAARKLLNIPQLRISGSATKDGGPPREARRGFRWQHDVSGHWLEMKVGRNRRSKNSSRRTSTIMTQEPPTLSEKARAISGISSTSDAAINNPPASHVTAYSTIDETSSPSSKEGFLEKNKRRLGMKQQPKPDTPAIPSPRAILPRTRTGEVLDQTSSVLRLVALKHRPTSASTSSSTLSIADPRQLRKRPTHKLTHTYTSFITPTRTHDDTSSSSSLRSQIQGKPPLSTPDEREMYTAADQTQYFRVELTDPGAPTFLPSEARRVNTPPINKNRARGFFFDYKPPNPEDSGPKPFRERKRTYTVSEEAAAMSPDGSGGSGGSGSGSDGLRGVVKGGDGGGKGGGSKTRRVSATEWYNVQLEAIEAEAATRDMFLKEIPDHLDTSPSCPRNVGGKQKGFGVCPMHGRNEEVFASVLGEDGAGRRRGDGGRRGSGEGWRRGSGERSEGGKSDGESWLLGGEVRGRGRGRGGRRGKPWLTRTDSEQNYGQTHRLEY